MEVFATILEFIFAIIITGRTQLWSVQFNISNHRNVIEYKNMTRQENGPMQKELEFLLLRYFGCIC